MDKFKNALTTAKVAKTLALDKQMTGVTKEVDLQIKRTVSAAVEESFRKNYSALFDKIDKHVKDYVTSTLNARSNEIKREPFKLTEDLENKKNEGLKALTEEKEKILKTLAEVIGSLEGEVKDFKEEATKEVQKMLIDFREEVLLEVSEEIKKEVN